jgi:hypothetical protein
MAELKNSKYIFTEYRDFLPPPPGEMNKLIEDHRKRKANI